MSSKEETSLDRALYLVNQIVVEKRIDSRAALYLDSLLSWLGGRSSDATEEIKNQFQSKSIDAGAAKDLSLSVLDDFLFSNQENPLRTLGFSKHPGKDTLKYRYRRLMQVYHPDRGLASEKWSNDRAELINSAYLAAEDYVPPKATQREGPTGGVKAPNLQTELSRSGSIRGHDKLRIRRSLGSASKFRRKVLIALFSISSVLLTLIYISSYDGDTGNERQEVRIDEGLQDFETVASSQYASVEVEKASRLFDEMDNASYRNTDAADLYEEFDGPKESLYSFLKFDSVLVKETTRLADVTESQLETQSSKAVSEEPDVGQQLQSNGNNKKSQVNSNTAEKKKKKTKTKTKTQNMDDQSAVVSKVVQKTSSAKENQNKSTELIALNENSESQLESANSTVDKNKLESDELSVEAQRNQKAKVVKTTNDKKDRSTKVMSRDEVLVMKDSAKKYLVDYVNGVVSGKS